MSDQPSKGKVLFDESGDGDDAFAAVTRGEARVGEVLAHMRAARGFDLADVAANLLIREQFLAAIENGNFDLLPGPTYAIGFVRSYADFLGLDGNEAVRVFKSEREGGAAQAKLNFPEPVAESRIPRGAILFISLILGITAYGGWYYLSSHDMQLADLVPQVPQAMNDTAPATPDAAKTVEAAAAAKPAAEPAAEPAAPAAAKPETPPAEIAAVPSTAPAPVAVPEPARATAPAPSTTPARGASPPAVAPEAATVPEAAPAPAASPPTAGSQSATARGAIEIRAKADSWVQIRGPGGRVVVMRIFRAGDTFKVPDEKGLTLMTGNAGAIEITVDGKAVPAVGPFGAVRRDVALDPERLRAGTAATR